MSFTGLCLSGGGSNGYSQIGALEYCQQKGYLNQICAYSGTSVGSILCTLLCCGFTPSEIYGYSSKISLIPEPKDVNFYYFFKNKGLINFHKIEDELKIIVKKKLDCVPTLEELFKLTKKELFITSTNITRQECVHFNHLTHPYLNVVDAIKMSCNLPWIFTQISYNDDLYVDGGLSEHIPFSVFKPGQNVLNICTSGIGTDLAKFGDFVKYSFDVVFYPIKRLEKQQREHASASFQFIDILVENQILNIVMPENEKEKLWLKGYNAAKQWDEWRWKD
jgi:predicted acylesterase/phospholipase RssA